MKTTLASLFIATLLFIGCKDETVGPIDNEQELITDVVFQLIEEAGTDTVTASFRDADGEGGAAPTIDTLKVKAGKTYLGSLALYDKSKTPADTITNEIEEESNVHRFDFMASGDAAGRLTITTLDKDTNNLPIGLHTRVVVTAGGAATGTLKVKLNHFGTVAKGASNSDETDIDIDFPLLVE
jgi:hypothetical protein